MLRKIYAFLACIFIVAPALAQLGPGGTTYGTAVITGGSINNTPIGATIPAAITATNIVGTGTITVSAGTSASPSFTFLSNTNSGLYSSGAATLGAAVGGAAQAFLQPDNFRLRSSVGLNWSNGNAESGSGDTFLFRDAAGTLALRNGVNAQSFRVYNTYTDASNNERGVVQFNASVFEIGTENNGTGVSRNLRLKGGTASIYINMSSVDRWAFSGSGNFAPVASASYDIGSATTTVRGIYAVSVMTAPVAFASLLTCNASNKGIHAAITDSTLAYNGTNLGSVAAGSGANFSPVICDGTSWKIGG